MSEEVKPTYWHATSSQETQPKPTSTIGDKIPGFVKPYVQQIIGGLVTAAILAATGWLVSQGLMKPIQTELQQQKVELEQQNTQLKKLVSLQQNQNLFWGVSE